MKNGCFSLKVFFFEKALEHVFFRNYKLRAIFHKFLQVFWSSKMYSVAKNHKNASFSMQKRVLFIFQKIMHIFAQKFCNTKFLPQY